MFGTQTQTKTNERKALWLQFIVANVLMLAAVVIAFLLEQWLLPNTATVLILLLGVISTASLTSLIPSAYAALLGAVVFNVMFTKPRGTLHMTEPVEIATLAVFIATAMVCIYWVINHRNSQAKRHAAEVRSQLLLSLSHDLRTPLASVMGNLTTWLDYHPRLHRDEQNELISNAVFEAERLQSYIDNILHATRFAYQQVHLNREHLSLQSIIADVVDRFPMQQDSLDVKLPAKDVFISGQRVLLEQGLFNLIDNALRYRSPQSIVSTTLDTSSNGLLQLIIRNQVAEDFPTQSLQQWGQPLVSSKQGDSGTGGLGLGLAVAASIFSAHAIPMRFRHDKHSGTVVIELVLQTVDGGRHVNR
ncbi:DUF4118 domain-containing protein [Pseudidiomarina sp. CB1]|uniref:sensor histidine kinase n=1 Tax=Pseudidiomarina sp. CB1 TaxID=2972484 RepID=UPI0021634FD1|nr:DUF4118 domain-containing protein [Pseudidiomarina sp. CB1]